MGKVINRLPAHVASQLRSTTILSNVAQIAEELVCNCLDAGATKIEIAVDGEACHMKVEDDGHGISRDDLTLVGERHATSKLRSLDELEGGVTTLGFRGEALSSLSDISLVDITSRCRGMPNTYRKILKGGATLSVGLSSEHRTYGTTVIVRDMFYNQPVRRRLLHSSPKKILQSVKECVMQYVLIHPQVSFTVKDLGRKEILLHTKSSATLDSTLCDLFGADMFSKLQEINYAHGHLRLAGFLSKAFHCHPSKALQYFYINRRYVLKTALHKLVNSYSGKSKESLRHEEQVGKGEVASGRSLSPAFVLNLSCPYSDYDITFEASKTLVEFKDWTPVVSFVRSIIQKIWGDVSFGNRHGFSHAPEKSSAAPEKKTASMGNGCHGRNVKHPADGSKDEYPPMVVRRAMVQSDSYHPGDFSKNLLLEDKATEASDDSLQRPGIALKRSLLSPLVPCKNNTKRELFSGIRLKEQIGIDDALKLQNDNDSDSDCAILSKQSWHISPLRLQMNFDPEEERFPKILDSDWFSKSPHREKVNFTQEDDLFPEVLESDWVSHSVFSPESKRKRLLDSASSAARLLFPSGENGAFKPARNKYEGSSSTSRKVLRNSSSPTDFCASPLEWSIKKSRTSGLRVRFKDDDDVRFLSPVKDTSKKLRREWWEPEDVTPLLSERHDSIPKILDTSDFLAEVDSCSPKASTGVDPLRGWKWPEFDSDYSENEMNWSPRIDSKQRRINFDGSDSDEVAEFFPARSHSFDPKLDKYLGNIEINIPKHIDFKLDTEDDELDMTPGGTETAFQKTRRNMISSPNVKLNIDALQHHYGIDRELYKLQPQSILDAEVDKSSDNTKLPSELPGKLKQKPKPGKEDKPHHLSAFQKGQPRRCHSGPPFCRPSKRDGADVNPCNRVSTTRTMGNIDEDAVVTQIDPDEMSETDCKAFGETDLKWDLPQKEVEVVKVTSSQWEEPVVDCNGQLYIQSTESLDQDKEHQLTETMDRIEEERPEVVLDSLEQTEEVDFQQLSKYRSTEANGNTATDEAELLPDTVKAMLKEWSNPCMKKDDDILDLSSGVLASTINSLLPCSITKDALKQARVLQQVDKKFIASVSRGVLLLFDQHAADERVRLEELRKDVLGGDIAKEMSLLSSTQQLTMTFTEQQTLQAYSQQIQDWGWRFKITVERKLPPSQRLRNSTGGMCKVLLSAVPSILGVKLTGADLIEYIQQLTDTQGSSTPPPAVIRLLNYKACRGAIMFGDKLLPAECNQLIDHLKRTQLCFQCAHGRPTMVPLVDIKALRKRFGHNCGNSRPGANMEAVKGSHVMCKADASCRQWHGLQLDAKPSLQRARERFAQAQDV